MITTGTIATASIGLISVSPGGYGHVSDATTTQFTVLSGASGTVASGSAIQVDVQSEYEIMTASAGLMQVKGGYGEYHLLGSGGTAKITGTAQFNAWASSQGTMTMYGTSGSCTIKTEGKVGLH